MNYFERFFGHLHTVNQHRREVRRLCFKCGLYWQGLTHDLSKYSLTEFTNGVKYYSHKFSPHVREREEKGYSDAWLHHKGRNKHHMDYWIDKGPVIMPKKYLVEMLCDRLAASKIYAKNALREYTDHDALDYYLKESSENVGHTITNNDIYMLLSLVANIGEDAALKRVKLYLMKGIEVKNIYEQTDN